MKNKANLYFKAISKRGALTETDKHLFMNVNVDDEAVMFLFDANNQVTERPKQREQTEITIIFKDGYSFKGTVEQLRQRFKQSETQFSGVCNPRENSDYSYISLENVSVHERELKNIPYRWVNDNGIVDADGDTFQVFYKSKWREAQSIDFEF